MIDPSVFLQMLTRDEAEDKGLRLQEYHVSPSSRGGKRIHGRTIRVDGGAHQTR
jgi:hypothetical protein